MVSGLLSVDDIRNDPTKACTLLLGAEPPAPVRSPQRSAAVAPGKRPDAAVGLPDDSKTRFSESPSEADAAILLSQRPSRMASMSGLRLADVFIFPSTCSLLIGWQH